MKNYMIRLLKLVAWIILGFWRRYDLIDVLIVTEEYEDGERYARITYECSTITDNSLSVSVHRL
jgi:hypothetical protein